MYLDCFILFCYLWNLNLIKPASYMFLDLQHSLWFSFLMRLFQTCSFLSFPTTSVPLSSPKSNLKARFYISNKSSYDTTSIMFITYSRILVTCFLSEGVPTLETDSRSLFLLDGVFDCFHSCTGACYISAVFCAHCSRSSLHSSLSAVIWLLHFEVLAILYLLFQILFLHENFPMTPGCFDLFIPWLHIHFYPYHPIVTCYLGLCPLMICADLLLSQQNFKL